MLHVVDPWAAYQLDMAAAAFVSYVRGQYYAEDNRMKHGGHRRSEADIVKEAEDILLGKKKPPSNYERLLSFGMRLGARIIEA